MSALAALQGVLTTPRSTERANCPSVRIVHDLGVVLLGREEQPLRMADMRVMGGGELCRCCGVAAAVDPARYDRQEKPLPLAA